MEGRIIACLIASFVLGLSGCAKNSALALRAKDEPIVVEAATGKAEAKRKPLPSTCVAMGQVTEQAAADPRQTPAGRQQLLDQARRAYQQALDTDPKHMPAMLALARLYKTIGDRERELATYNRAIKAEPKNHMLYYELGMCHARHKEWAAALEQLAKASELDPENRRYAHMLGYCQARAGKIDDSLGTFTRLEGKAKAHYNVARMLQHLNDQEQCKAHLQLSLESDPEFVPARQLMASLDHPSNSTSQQGGKVEELQAPVFPQ